MKEKQFLKELEELNLEKLEITPYYAVNDEGEVLLDKEGIIEEFELKLKELREILD